MRSTVIVIAALLALPLVAGCPQQRRIATTPEQPPVQQPSSSQQGRAGTDSAGASTESITERQLSTSGDSGQAGQGKADQTDISSLQELSTALRDIHFDYDKHDIRDDAKPVLKDLAGRLAKDGQLSVIIEGHCDDRGTGEYNLALGDRRASATKIYLLSLGVPSGRMQTVSYGEEKPLCNAATEECWEKNRRAHFVLAVPKK